MVKLVFGMMLLLMSNLVSSSPANVDVSLFDVEDSNIKTVVDFKGNRFPADETYYDEMSDSWFFKGRKLYRNSNDECIYVWFKGKECLFNEDSQSGQCETIDFVNNNG